MNEQRLYYGLPLDIYLSGFLFLSVSQSRVFGHPKLMTGAEMDWYTESFDFTTMVQYKVTLVLLPTLH